MKALLTNDERFDGLSGEKLQDLTLTTLKEIQSTQAVLRRIVERLVGDV
ncbi:MAG: hypothetical protein E7I62_05940 [Bilophila wadsworthia]|nr:hypothetical protein [Bilophila wadsworthia]MDU4375128.1 hypothetical protein [Bilophila wadsworthia]